jgi:Domain of unknown function (DUF4384)
MISALLLPLLLAGFAAPDRPAAAPHDDPPIQLWISSDRRFLPGERAKVEVRTEEDGYLIVMHVDPDGYLRVLFPLDPDKDNFIRGGKKYEVRGRGDREAFEADGKGRGTVYAAVSKEPFRFDGFVVGDHWDYRALAPSRLSNNPEAELNELVRRVAQGNFDYDLLSYDVVERVVYAGDSPSLYRSWYDDPWCYHFSCGRSYYGSPFSISIFFGRPYRRYYYDPYYYAYAPFYNPFFYDPYYYAPIYYPRYVYPRRFYGYPYRDRYYYDSYRYHQPYTPYRFRGADGFSADYRDRRYNLRRSINTVYNPPISPVREPSVATPVRRVIEEPGEQLPRGTRERRLTDNARRVQDQQVEARRAREAEPPSRAAPAAERVRERSTGEPRLIRREVEARRSSEARPAGGDDGRRTPARVERREERRAQPAREQPRAEPRAAPRAPDRRSWSPPPDRGGGQREGRSSGGGSRPADDGGRRRR